MCWDNFALTYCQHLSAHITVFLYCVVVCCRVSCVPPSQESDRLLREHETRTGRTSFSHESPRPPRDSEEQGTVARGGATLSLMPPRGASTHHRHARLTRSVRDDGRVDPKDGFNDDGDMSLLVAQTALILTFSWVRSQRVFAQHTHTNKHTHTQP